MQAGSRGEASLVVAEAPDVLYDAVTDVRRMGEWSPECRRCEWIDGASGPAVGARFKGSNRNGLARWSTTARVVTADRGREFGFVTAHRGRDMTKWTYRFEPAPGGTNVTESFEMLVPMPWYFKVADRVLMRVNDRHADLEANMAATLTRLKASVERSG